MTTDEKAYDISIDNIVSLPCMQHKQIIKHSIYISCGICRITSSWTTQQHEWELMHARRNEYMFVCTERERDEVNFDFQIKACSYIRTHLTNQKQEINDRERCRTENWGWRRRLTNTRS